MRRQPEREANSLSSTSGLERLYCSHQRFSGSRTAAVPIGRSQWGSSGVRLSLGWPLSMPYWALAGPAARAATRPRAVAAIANFFIAQTYCKKTPAPRLTGAGEPIN